MSNTFYSSCANEWVTDVFLAKYLQNIQYETKSRKQISMLHLKIIIGIIDTYTWCNNKANVDRAIYIDIVGNCYSNA